MLQFRRSFEAEKYQLQELNNRLGQYLSRTKQLEHENSILISEINKIRQEKAVEWNSKYMNDMRDLRRMVGQLSFEKSRAEMEREKLWQEFQMLQSMCCEEQVICKDIGGELKGSEKELHKAQQTNRALEERLFQLENEYKRIEDSHRQEITNLRNQAYSRPIFTQRYHGPPAVSMEDIQECALSLSEGWMDTFEMYRRKVEDMEESIKADQMRLDDIQREKMHYVSELDQLRQEAEKQAQIQINLEEQLIHMQDNFHCDITQYQVIIEELEREREMLANNMAEKVRDHQELLQVKMDLGMEVAYYRLDYCNSILIGIPSKNIQPLQYVQNCAARTLMGVRKHHHITPILKSLHWLPVQYRIEFKVSLLSH
uniref:IF rod domain-containing protein n=1 Tax=Esox lucius TaxID=8010 RepID=A0AAY5K8C9_ESOLU